MSRWSRRPNDEQLEKEIRAFIIQSEAAASLMQGGDASSETASALPVGHLGILSDAVKGYLRTKPATAPPFVPVIAHVLLCMDLTRNELRQARELIISEVETCACRPTKAATFVDFLRIVTLRALLLPIRQRAEGYFYGQGAQVDEIEDLGGQVIVKVLRMLETGKAPDRNVGAYFAMICRRVWIDRYRRTTRNRQFVGEEEDAGNQAVSPDCPLARALVNLSIKEIEDPKKMAVIIDYRHGYAPKEIAVRVDMSLAKVQRVIRDYLGRP